MKEIDILLSFSTLSARNTEMFNLNVLHYQTSYLFAHVNLYLLSLLPNCRQNIDAFSKELDNAYDPPHGYYLPIFGHFI